MTEQTEKTVPDAYVGEDPDYGGVTYLKCNRE